ncbi:MAG: 30S ribosomal protein S4 [Thaumarchaeota archaeon]|nr:30S ribosomal protein S4 [Nitrososphaerota archaeon]
MGDPKKPSKQYVAPRNPWRADMLVQDLHYLGTFGLRNKRELWRTQTELSRIRKQARQLLAKPQEIRIEDEKKFLQFLERRGLIADQSSLDDVLILKVEDLLERRLQTMVWRKGLARTPYHARQLVNHSHILVKGRAVTIPSLIVRKEEESTIQVRNIDTSIKSTEGQHNG